MGKAAGKKSCFIPTLIVKVVRRFKWQQGAFSVDVDKKKKKLKYLEDLSF